MNNYTSPFIVEIPNVEGWEDLRDYLKSIGFKEVKTDKLYYNDIKPIITKTEPSCLKFYLKFSGE